VCLRRSVLEWFEIWKEVVYDHKNISFITLAETTGASLWTIDRFKKDFILYYSDIYYKDHTFHLKKFELDKTLSHTLQEDLK